MTQGYSVYTHPQGVSVPKRVRSIAIIGGGPSGAVTLDTLVKENAFDKIVVFERKDALGGVWNVEEEFNEKIQVAPGSSTFKLNPPLRTPDFEGKEQVITKRPKQYRFSESAGYKGMRTNVPQQLMCFSDDRSWGIPDERKIEEDYCYGPDVKAYVQRYFSRHTNKHNVEIVLKTAVENVQKVSKSEGQEEPEFVLTLRNERDDGLDSWYKQKFDAIIIASGHYHVPYIPSVPGLDTIFEKYPEKIIHSKYFTPNLDQYPNEKVLVVGGKISGLDIVISLSKTSNIIYHSAKDREPDSKQKNDGFENIIPKDVVTKYELDINDKITAYFTDGSKVEGIDRVFYATGYKQSFPYMDENFPGFTTGTILPDLYEHTFYVKDPLIAVIGLPVQAVTFRVFEFQAIWVSRFLSGKVQLPSFQVQKQWTKERYETYGDNRVYHSFGPDKFDWTRRITKIAGGVDPIGEDGKSFYVYTPEDEELHQKILKKYAEEVYFFLDPTKQYF